MGNFTCYLTSMFEFQSCCGLLWACELGVCGGRKLYVIAVNIQINKAV